MLFPKKRLSLTNTYQGKNDPEGWIILDLTGLDLEGAAKLYLPMEDILQARSRGDVQAERLKRARSLLGGDEDETWTEAEQEG